MGPGAQNIQAMLKPHKTEHHDRDRVICIGKNGQAVLRVSALLFVLILGLLVHVEYGWGKESYPWKARQPSGVPVRVAVEPQTDARFAHLSWNKVVRTPRGTLVLAYVAGTFHGNHGGGCPAISRSVDNGESFSAPHLLREFGPGQDYMHCGNLALGLAEDGALVLLAMAFDGDNANHIFGWRSEDDGQTWSAINTEALGPNDPHHDFGYPWLTPLENNRWLMFYYHGQSRDDCPLSGCEFFVGSAVRTMYVVSTQYYDYNICAEFPADSINSQPMWVTEVDLNEAAEP